VADERPQKIRAVILIGEDPVREMLEGGTPAVAIGVDVSWDPKAKAWRATWPDGIQFGQSEYEAALNGLRQRLVHPD
jgi:hypothetical protein